MHSTIGEVREDAAILARNIAALRLRNPALAVMIEQSEPHAVLRFEPAAQADTVAATLDGKALASRRRPLEEAERWAEAIDLEKHAVIVVHGFGLGYHIKALAERCDELSALLVLETDIALLRGVLSRIDHASWLRGREIRFISHPGEVSALTASLRGLEAPLSFGVCTVVHPASAGRLAVDIEAFNKTFPAAVAAVRTQIITTLMQSDISFRNALGNAERYANAPGIGQLKDIARGRLGIVVSAGPSLRRNVELLKDPAARSRCVVIAVQTVLKPLLEMGIRPDFVTAIDYAEISKRFYEGLTAEDVRGITLVSTGRAHPAIHAAWPGQRRFIEEEILRTALDEELSSSPDGYPRGTLPDAATVAHLSYSLARHLGCDPVALIGQDLAFTDGQYYADGAAIHTTWGGELNSFNTLEMLEWQRIVRMRSYLYKREDHLGRPVYTDEQMATYAAQFEQLFAGDLARSLTTIDATEGGISKKHTRILTLSETLAAYAGPETEPIPAFPCPANRLDDERSRLVRERLSAFRHGVRRIARLSRDTEGVLERIERHAEDTARVNTLVAQVHRNRDEVHTIEPAWTLLQRLNQTAALKRYAADRRIARAADLPELDRFRLRVQRDLVNVRWMGEAGDHLDGILRAIDQSFEHAAGGDAASATSGAGDEPGDGIAVRGSIRVWAILVETPKPCGSISSTTPVEPGVSPPLRLLAERLARCGRLRGIVVVTDEPGEARRLLGTRIGDLSVRVIESPARTEERRAADHARRIARLVAPNSWRGGLANLSVFDEAFDATRLVAALRAENTIEELDAAVIAGADWCLLDPSLVDRLIAQHEESPEQFGIAFTQAVPGLGPVLMTRQNLEQFAMGQVDNAVWSNLGGTLGYIPTHPRADPIGRANCIPLDGIVRDAGVRLIPDTACGRHAVAYAIRALGAGIVDADGASIARAASGAGVIAPSELVIGSSPAVRAGGASGSWYRCSPESPGQDGVAGVTPGGLDGVLGSLGDAVRDLVLTIGLTGWRGWSRLCPGDGLRPADPLATEEWRELIGVARRHGVGAIHLRTDLNRAEDARRLLGEGVDIISIDAWANDAALYQRLTGTDGMRTVFENIQHLLERRRVVHGLPAPWIVPRITRCDATYETIEAFYDKWLMLAGAAVIDPLPAAIPGERIAPLTLPGFVSERLCRERMVMLSDGWLALDDGTPAATSAGEAARRWCELVDARRAECETTNHTHSVSSEAA